MIEMSIRISKIVRTICHIRSVDIIDSLILRVSNGMFVSCENLIIIVLIDFVVWTYNALNFNTLRIFNYDSI
nr:MAG TPA: hypothetical protein [Caudoviricetes sp.]DAV60180.1 MAG TPA: hypothetical protein [Caudoviricetes sp.]